MISVDYQTAGGNIYPLEFQYKRVCVSDLVYCPEQVHRYCKDGCKNFDFAGGCPPRAPLLEKLYAPTKECWLILCKFDSVYKPEKVLHSNNRAIHWKFQDGILARVMNKLGQELCVNLGGKFLATGYCMGCPGKKCSFKLGESVCRHPARRTFSMEATGIHVVDTVEKNFSMKFYWYTKEQLDIPYMMKCIAFFPQEKNQSLDCLWEMLNKLLFVKQ